MWGEIPQMSQVPLLWQQSENINFFVGSEDEDVGSRKDGRGVTGSLIRTAREAREKASKLTSQRKVRSFESLPDKVDLGDIMYQVMQKKGNPGVLLGKIRENSHTEHENISLSTIIKMDRNPYLVLNHVFSLLNEINNLFLKSQMETKFQKHVSVVAFIWEELMVQGEQVIAEEALLGASHKRKPSLEEFIKFITHFEKHEKLKKLFVAAVGGPHLKHVFDAILKGIQERRGKFKPLEIPFDIKEIKEIPEHFDRTVSILEVGDIQFAVRQVKRQKKKGNKLGRITYIERRDQELTYSFLYRLLVIVNDYGYQPTSKAMLDNLYLLINVSAQNNISAPPNELSISSHNNASVSSHNEASTYSNWGEDFESEFEFSNRSTSDGRLDDGVEKELPKISIKKDEKGKEKEIEKEKEKEKEIEKEVNSKQEEIEEEVIGLKEIKKGPNLFLFYSSLLKKISQSTIKMFDNGVKEKFSPLFQQRIFNTIGKTAQLKVKTNKKTYCEISLTENCEAKVSLRRLHTFILQFLKKDTISQKVRIGHMWVQLAFVIDLSVKDQYKVKITDFSTRKITSEEKVKSKLVNKAQKFIRSEVLKYSEERLK